MTPGFPPYADAIGATLGEDGVILMPFADHLIGRPGFLHGGAISGLLEIAAMVALRRSIDAGIPSIKPINLTVDFLRGGKPMLTFASGIVTRIGNRVANVEARAWQDDRERPIASARLNYLLRRA